jgi:hypothetical protein
VRCAAGRDVVSATSTNFVAISARVINVSSAAQAPVSLDALAGRRRLGDMADKRKHPVRPAGG